MKEAEWTAARKYKAVKPKPTVGIHVTDGNENRSGSPHPMWPRCTSGDPGSPCCIILDSITEGVFTVDLNRRITAVFNRAAEQITGFSAREAIGQHCFDVLRSNICQTDCPFKRILETGDPVQDQPSVIINRTGAEVAVSVTSTLIRDERGEIVGAVETFRDLSMVETLRKTLSNRYRLAELVSKNPSMQEIFEILPDIAESDSTVLIQGPSGSGKDLLASAIHELSDRKDEPFVKINCGAIPDTLLESELFGYVRGAFTDARRDKPGRFALANHGTLFLDEVGDTSPALQVKLLRVLEEKQFVPLGGTTPETVDVRIVAASNKPLEKLVEEARFRDDLYYRLNIIKIELPALCQRKEDIPLLVENFLSKLNSFKGKRILGVTDDVMSLLMNYHFPGNIRELENILEHAYVLCKEPVISRKYLPVEFLENALEATESSQKISPLESTEARTIQQVLKKHGGNRILAARELGISRSTLWRRIKKFNLT